MREIEFRGKSELTREWVYGGYAYNLNTDVSVIWEMADTCNYRWPVIPETVGQYTGLKDKNDMKIFEGDIVAYCGECFQTAIVCYGLYNENEENCAHSQHYGLFFKTVQVQGRKVLCPDTPVHRIDDKAAFWPDYCADSPLGIPQLFVEVVGNIHDNPELLEVRGCYKLF